MWLLGAIWLDGLGPWPDAWQDHELGWRFDATCHVVNFFWISHIFCQSLLCCFSLWQYAQPSIQLGQIGEPLWHAFLFKEHWCTFDVKCSFIQQAAANNYICLQCSANLIRKALYKNTTHEDTICNYFCIQIVHPDNAWFAGFQSITGRSLFVSFQMSSSRCISWSQRRSGDNSLIITWKRCQSIMLQ